MKLQGTRFWLGQLMVISASSLLAGAQTANMARAGISVSTSHSSEIRASSGVNEETSLPNAPSVVAAQEPQQAAVSPAVEPSVAQHPTAPSKAPLDSSFIVANSFLLGSTIADAEMIARCRPSSCQAVPDGIRQRGQLYAIGIAASLGVTYVSYHLKKNGSGLWILPVALFTVGNAVYATHAAQFSTSSAAGSTARYRH
jgi:hypothetical protein